MVIKLKDFIWCRASISALIKGHDLDVKMNCAIVLMTST